MRSAGGRRPRAASRGLVRGIARVSGPQAGRAGPQDVPRFQARQSVLRPETDAMISPTAPG